MIKLIKSFLSNRNFKVLVKGEMSTPRETQAGGVTGFHPDPYIYNFYVNDFPQNSWPFSRMTPVYKPLAPKWAKLSESCSAVLHQRR